MEYIVCHGQPLLTCGIKTCSKILGLDIYFYTRCILVHGAIISSFLRQFEFAAGVMLVVGCVSWP